jgi:hypothetical protein
MMNWQDELLLVNGNQAMKKSNPDFVSGFLNLEGFSIEKEYNRTEIPKRPLSLSVLVLQINKHDYNGVG